MSSRVAFLSTRCVCSVLEHRRRITFRVSQVTLSFPQPALLNLLPPAYSPHWRDAGEYRPHLSTQKANPVFDLFLCLPTLHPVRCSEPFPCLQTPPHLPPLPRPRPSLDLAGVSHAVPLEGLASGGVSGTSTPRSASQPQFLLPTSG